ncbi:MAG: DUF5714 domain-containing protein [Thermodesulfobacteriota bacterium]
MQNLTWHRRDSALFFFRENLTWLKAHGLTFTLSMCVTAANFTDLPQVADLAGKVGAANLLGGLWGRGRGGLAFGVLLRANPLKPRERRRVQEAVQAVLTEFSSWEAARCCQRECWLALRRAAELSRTLLPLPLTADAPLVCRRSGDRPDCLRSRCPLWDHQGAKAGFLVRQL